eukprot:s345_g3.t1
MGAGELGPDDLSVLSGFGRRLLELGYSKDALLSLTGADSLMQFSDAEAVAAYGNGGASGEEVLETIVAGCPNWLKPGGRLWLVTYAPNIEEPDHLLSIARPQVRPIDLVPEAEWLERFPDALEFIIGVPADEKVQVSYIRLSLLLSHTIASVKKKLADIGIRIPIPKMRLREARVGFMADERTGNRFHEAVYSCWKSGVQGADIRPGHKQRPQSERFAAESRMVDSDEGVAVRILRGICRSSALAGPMHQQKIKGCWGF